MATKKDEEKQLDFYQKLQTIQFELKAPKSQYNGFGKYNYRNQEDILEAVKPLLYKYGLVMNISDDIREIAGRIYVEATVRVSDKDNTTYTTALAREEENKKGMDSAQLTGATSSYARKYALNGMFLIDDTKDSDSTNTHGKAAKPSLDVGTDAFSKAVKFVEGGGALSAIESKYELTKEARETLSSL
jgi:hypothetical protein